MQLSIREASRFVIGAAMMRAKAIEASGNTGITFDNVALAALRDGADGQKLRQSIETLADQESIWLRSTPPHVLKSERVLQSRVAEVNTFTAISAAVVSTVELADRAAVGDSDAKHDLHDKYVEAFHAIDGTPGSTQDRRQLETVLREQTTAATEHRDFILASLKEAETAYLDAGATAILSRYDKSVDRSNDFDM